MSFGDTCREWLIALAALAEQNDAKRILISTQAGLTYEYIDGRLTVIADAGEGKHPATFSLTLADLEDEKYEAVVPKDWRA